MAAQPLSYQGINRAVSDYGSGGACEELINLRPTTEGLVPIKPFAVKMSSVGFDRIFTHYVGAGVNYISITLDDDDLTIALSSADGSTQTTLKTISVSSLEAFAIDDVHFASAGNYLLVSIADIEDSFYSNIAFLWNGEQYNIVEADIPAVTASVQEISGMPVEYEGVDYDHNTDKQEVMRQLDSAFNAIRELNKDYCFGVTLFAIAFKTTAGQVFWTGQWFAYDPFPYIKDLEIEYLTGIPFYTATPSGATEVYPDGVFVVRAQALASTGKVYLAGVKLRMTLSQIAGWDADTSILESVEIYASKPAPYLDPVNKYGETDYSNPSIFTFLPRNTDKDMNLEGQLLYHMKSIPMAELASGAQTFPLEFGGTIQTTNSTLQVDPGMVKRYGNILSYNARFHYYDSVAETFLGMPRFSYPSGSTTASRYVAVTYNDGSKDKTVYIGQVSLPDSGISLVVAPSRRIKEVIVYWQQSGSTFVYLHFPMTPSTTYNYSVNTGNYEQKVHQGAAPSSPVTSFIVEEPDAINVTEQYSPFVFKVDHSYLAPGAVLDIQPQMVAVADVSYGDYPLNVFTNRGTYALLQGQGTTLYGNFKSVSNLVTGSNCIPTESGTFFLASGELWMVSGDNAVLVSDALSQGPHKYIRSAFGYDALKGAAGAFVSQVSFREYAESATLSYNRYRDELIVSNPAYPYSYVLSLKYRQWFKLGMSVSQDSVGDTLAKAGFIESPAAVGVTGTAKFSTSLLHDYQDVGVEIEVIVDYADGGEDIFDTTITRGEETDQQLIERLVSTWNASNGTTIIAGTPAISGNYYEIPLTFVRSIPGVAEIDSVAILSYGESSYADIDIVFSAPVYDVLDFSTEGEGAVQVHLQSRPFSFGYAYSHVHRLLAMVRASLSVNETLNTALWGSDDLHNWKLLAYASRTNETFSQIRTAPAARSWRYYTITLAGKAPLDTDFGPFIVDYDPVMRRLG